MAHDIIEATQSKLVLEDCRAALYALEQQKLRGVKWRLNWVATVSLLRAVGHVLDKVDAESCPEMRAAIDEVWSEWKLNRAAHGIFFDFIEDERNSILKEYRFKAREQLTVTGLSPMAIPMAREVRLQVMGTGPFAYRRLTDLVREAIEWWEQQLEEITTRAAAEKIAGRISHPCID